MMTFTIRIRRRTLYIFAAILLSYLASYGVFRTSGLLVHTAQNRYTGVSLHDVKVSGSFEPYTPIALLYTPLRIIESVGWPAVDTVTSL